MLVLGLAIWHCSIHTSTCIPQVPLSGLRTCKQHPLAANISPTGASIYTPSPLASSCTHLQPTQGASDVQSNSMKLLDGISTLEHLSASRRIVMLQLLPCFHTYQRFQFVLLIMSLVFICIVVVADDPLCHLTDLRALRGFYNSVNSSNLHSWSAHNDCCLWLGICCDPQGRVFSIDLPSLGLAGAIPSILFSLSALQTLDLSNNSFSGRIPSNIANASSLTVLHLSYNPLLTGSLPACMPPALRLLDVSHCSLHGMVPQGITNSSSIREVLISHNSFSSFGPNNNVPCAALHILDASDNLFSANSLQFMMNCTMVRYLNFDRNQIQGPMPWQLGGLAGLEVLRLQENLVTGRIPQVIGDCVRMRQLWLDDNDLHGVIPETLGKLSMLTVLSLTNNRLEGGFPKAITRCASLRVLRLSGNMLSGSFPADLGSLRHLEVLLLANNCFSGFIPLERQFLTHLQVVNISNNWPGEPFTSGENEVQGNSFDVAHIAAWPWLVHKFLHFMHFCMASGRRFASQRHHNLQFVISQLTAKLVPVFKVFCLDSPGSVPLNPGQPYRHLLEISDADNSKGTSPVLIGVIAGAVVFFSVLFVVAVVVLCRLKVRPWKRRQFGRTPAKLPSLRKFQRESSRVFDPTLASISMRDLVKSTDGFDFRRVVGDGGFGLVYCATLADGRTVAVKKLSTDGIQGKREFEAEMETLGKIKHPNLVELLAYCKVGDERVLVYEFVQNGSLDTWLHERDDGPARLDWNKRVRIACGSAQGLCYLHHESDPHVIHRDIKSSNILLGKDFEPKIADFGLARTISPLVSHVSTDAAGTLGYMAPEYSMTLYATKQADVYSFGMLMLELASGRRPNLLMQEKNFRTLVKWACHMLQLGYEMDVVDPVLKTLMPPPSDQVRAYFAVACDCVSELPSNRPTMREVYGRLSLIQVMQPD